MVSVATGTKNKSSKSLLQWSQNTRVKEKAPSTPPHPDIAKTTLSPPEYGRAAPSLAMYQPVYLPYQDEAISAGRPTFHRVNQSDQELSSGPSARWSAKKKFELAGEIPFGVDNSRQSLPNNSDVSAVKKQPMSLADTLKAKASEPRSLSNMLAKK